MAQIALSVVPTVTAGTTPMQRTATPSGPDALGGAAAALRRRQLLLAAHFVLPHAHTAAALAGTTSAGAAACAAPLDRIPLPPIGFGTCCDDPEASAAQVSTALQCGYRLLDTSAHYPSEMGMGEALAEAEARGVCSRAEVSVCTKIWFDDMGYEPALASVKRSLARLRTERLDVLLIHFPGAPDAVQSPKRNRELRAQTWRACEVAQADGLARRIGLSNWTPRHLRETLLSCSVKPSVLQTEVHPRYQPVETLELCARHDIDVMAYCPLANGSPALLSAEPLRRAARECGRSPAQVALRWSLQKGLVPIPHASNAARMRENLEVLRFGLSTEQMGVLDAMEAADRASFDPSKIA